MMTRLFIIRSGTALGAFAALIQPAISDARSDLRFSVPVSVDVGYSNSPFLESSGSHGSGFFEVNVNPTLRIVNATSETDIIGSYSRQQYFNRYSSSNSYGGTLIHNQRLSERFSLNGSLGYDSSVSGQGNSFNPALPIFEPGPGGTNSSSGGSNVPVTNIPVGGVVVPITGVGNDLDLIGSRQRRNTLSGSLGGSYSPSSRDGFSFGGNGSKTTYPNHGLFIDNFTSYGGYLGYSRKLSERTSVGARVSVQRVNYDGSSTPDSTIISPQLTYDTRFSEHWTLNAAAGVTINRSSLGSFRRSSTSWSGNASLCHDASRSQLCITAARGSFANGLNGVQTQSSISASYTRQLSEYTSLNASVQYQHSAEGTFSSGRRLTDYYGGDLGLNRRFTRRLQGFVSGFYRDTSNVGFSRPADFGGRVGVTYTFGDVR